ncbi:MAG: 16S rRNA (guanine(527)-N(7))-methyltransferase RsmG [Chitinophagales bacterium]
MKALLEKYLELIEEENKKHNLVSRKTTREELWDHIEDSLSLVKVLENEEVSVIDIGSGQGLPAIPLAIRLPKSKFVLVESDLKKYDFLSMAIEQLHLQNSLVIRDRIEELGRKNEFRNTVDLVTVRAVASLSVVLEWGLPLLRLGGQVIAWKGPGIDLELENCKGALNILGGIVRSVEKYEVNGKTRFLVKVEKIEYCSDRYPRRGGLAKKRPL